MSYSGQEDKDFDFSSLLAYLPILIILGMIVGFIMIVSSDEPAPKFNPDNCYYEPEKLGGC